METSMRFTVLVCLMLLSAGCGSTINLKIEPPITAKIGQRCIVQFRRDALGTAAPTPVPPTTGSLNGAEVTIAGELKKVNPGWIVVAAERVEYVIPTDAILMVTFDRLPEGK
jgi:hypothetical protein